MLHNFPHEAHVHTEVTVDQAVSHPSHAAPLDLRVLRSVLLRELLGSFPDHLQTSHEGPLERRVSLEALERKILTRFYEVVGFRENVPKILTRLEGHRSLPPRCRDRYEARAPRL